MILSQNQFFTSEAADLRKRLAAVGGKLEVLNPNGDPEMQLQQAETAINTGTVNALMGSLVGIDSFQPALALATKKHIPVVLITFQPKELLEGQTNVALNYTAWGALGAKAMVQCLRQREGGDGSLAVVTWPGYSNIAQRIGGFMATVKNNLPAVKQYLQDGDGSEIKAFQLTQTLLQAHSNLNGGTGDGDDEVLGELKAFEAAGKSPAQLCLIGDNGTPAGLAALKAGKLYADIALQVPVLDAGSITALMALMKNFDDPEWSGKAVDLPGVLKLLYR